MKCQFCKHETMRDWSFYEGPITQPKTPHFYCRTCGAHFYRDTWYDKNQWFFYINEITFEEWQCQQREAEAAADQDRLESLHAHEQINHSDPEA